MPQANLHSPFWFKILISATCICIRSRSKSESHYSNVFRIHLKDKEWFLPVILTCIQFPSINLALGKLSWILWFFYQLGFTFSDGLIIQNLNNCDIFFFAINPNFFYSFQYITITTSIFSLIKIAISDH